MDNQANHKIFFVKNIFMLLKYYFEKVWINYLILTKKKKKSVN